MSCEVFWNSVTIFLLNVGELLSAELYGAGASLFFSYFYCYWST